MSLDSRKAVIGFSVGIIAFVASLYTWLKPSQDSAIARSQKAVKPEDVQVAITAYAAALQDGISQSELNDMNTDFAGKMNLRVYQDQNTGEIIATDLSGNEIASSAPVAQAA